MAVVLLGTAPLQAQGRGREGLWGSIGAGIGLGGFSCGSCVQGTSTTGAVGFLGLGTPINNNVHLSVEADGWFKNIDGNEIRLRLIGGVVQWYPSRRGFFLKGGLGYSSAKSDQTNASGNPISVTRTGMGFILGVGYDKQVARSVSLTGMLNFYGGPLEKSDPWTNVSYTVFQALFGVTIHKSNQPKREPLPWD